MSNALESNELDTDTTEVAGTAAPTAVATQDRPEVPAEYVAKLSSSVREVAEQICAEQPNVPRPEELVDLDSFSSIQTMLELENRMDVQFLESLGQFTGSTYDEIAEFVLQTIVADHELAPVMAKL